MLLLFSYLHVFELIRCGIREFARNVEEWPDYMRGYVYE